MNSIGARLGRLATAVTLAAVVWTVTAPDAAAQTAANAAAARLTAAEEAWSSTRMAFIGEVATAEDLYVWSLRWLEASRAVDPAGTPDALRAHLERMRWVEHEVAERVGRGLLDDAAVYRAGYYLAEALYWLTAAGYTP